MKFDVMAVIKEVGPVETIGAKGFQKRNLILTEKSGQYENLVCVEFSGDKLTMPEQFAAGQTVAVSGFINCREWNGKYFTSLRGSFISASQPMAEGPQDYPMPENFNQAPPAPQSYQPPQQGYQQPAQQPQAAPQQYQQPQGYPQQQQGYPQDNSQFSSNNDNVDTEIPF